MKHLLPTGLLLLFALAALPAHGAAQPLITGGNPVLQITTALPGQEPTIVANSQCTLELQGESVVTKVTVSTACPGQRFTLRILATNISGGGTAAPEVTLNDGTPAMDFITGVPGIGSPNKSATLQYTASATFSQGNSTELGNDLHTVTYTVVAQ
jgi:hypothetical protein